MKKTISKALALFLALAICLTLAPMSALAADSDFTIKDGVLKDYKGTDAHVVIPDGVTRIDAGAFWRNETIESVTIPDSVQSIYKTAFKGCKNLESVDFGNGVWIIYQSAFEGCTSLKHVTIGPRVTTIHESAFMGCTSLETVSMEKVNHINALAFKNCTSLREIDFGNGQLDIQRNAFEGCTSLTSVTISKNTDSVGPYAFKDTSLESVTILSNHLVIGAYAFTTPYLTTFYGNPGSSAERYANSEHHPYTFIALQASEAPNVSTASAWAQEQINEAYSIGLVPASLQGDYTKPITRAEFCALGVAMYEKLSNSEIYRRETFSDTTDKNVEKMAGMGVVSGTGDGIFNPHANLTREEAATMLARLHKTRSTAPLEKGTTLFADNDSVSSWALTPVAQMQLSGIMGGVGDNRFDPQGQYTREQSISTILRLYYLLKK